MRPKVNHVGLCSEIRLPPKSSYARAIASLSNGNPIRSETMPYLLLLSPLLVFIIIVVMIIFKAEPHGEVLTVCPMTSNQ